MPWKKKLLLAGIFSVTVFIIVVAVIRVILVKGSTDQMQNPSIDWLYMWSNVEMGVGLLRLSSKKSTKSQDDLAEAKRFYSSDPASRNHSEPLGSARVAHTVETSSHERAPGKHEKRG
ncbi:hypothetical protein HRG_014927 [Hirsutella rhossiliensis]